MISGIELLKALPVAIYLTDSTGVIKFYNEAAADLWGTRPVLGKDLWCGSLRLYTVDGDPLPHDECPMALTLKEGRPIHGEAVAERPDGTRVHFLAYPNPLRDESGKMIGAINLLMDITERQYAENALARLAAIVSSSDDAIISKTLTGQITSWNNGASRIFGYTENEIIGQPIHLIIPPELHDEENQILKKISRGEHIDHYETIRLTKDGRRVHISLTISPLYNKRGKIVGASKVARDISDRKRAEGMQRVLMGELNHRVKNTLAIVQSMAKLSLRRAASPEEFTQTFMGRIQALARAHSLFTNHIDDGATIGELVQEQVILESHSDRISCSGPLINLDSQIAVSLSLVLHELGTNARKYGSLSVPGGTLSVTWEKTINGDAGAILHWTERNGPLVHAPLREGLGSVLIRQSMNVHGGKTELRFDPEGFTCVISFPLPKGGALIDQMALPLSSRHASQGVPNPLSLRGKRILVIEDEPLVSLEIENCLLESGSQVVGPVGTLDRAMKMIESAEFDGALVDANLVGEPVDELAAALTRRNIPFLFLTGYSRESLPHGFRDKGVISKPYTPAQLVAATESMLRQGR